MRLRFDIENVKVTEFGVGFDDGDQEVFVAVPADARVKSALREMVAATCAALDRIRETPLRYDPSEKYDGIEHLYVPTDDPLAAFLRNVHEASNLPIDSKALHDPTKVFCYFVRMTDGSGQRLTALRRAVQFKGVLKKHLVQFVNDGLRLVSENVFKLDSDFDVLIDSEAVHILRPSGFEFAGKLQGAIREAVHDNIVSIQASLPFVDFSTIEEYATEHIRAARYLASIKTQGEARNIDKAALKTLCAKTGVRVQEKGGRISVEPGCEIAFLEVLDRRRYNIELVKGQPEQFRAASRHKLRE